MPYTVGYRAGVATDPERSAWRSSSPRPLTWAAWYPAALDVVSTEKLIGSPGAELFRMGLVAECSDINPQQDRWPIVLLSHGTGGSAQGLSWLGTYLATKGFISIGVSHHGNTAIEPYLPEGFLCWWERANDLTATLDWLAVNGPFAGRLDLTNVFAAGFSLGGYTVLTLAGAITNLQRFEEWRSTNGQGTGGPREFPDLADHVSRLTAQSEQFRQSMDRHSRSYDDRRIKAIMAFAPAPPVRAFEPDSLSDISIPIKIIVGRNDVEAPHDECALWLQQQNPAFDVLLLGQDVGHYVFLPEATDIGKTLEPSVCLDPSGVNRLSIHRSSAEAAETFFRDSID